jgi:hypothetical protein
MSVFLPCWTVNVGWILPSKLWFLCFCLQFSCRVYSCVPSGSWEEGSVFGHLLEWGVVLPGIWGSSWGWMPRSPSTTSGPESTLMLWKPALSCYGSPMALWLVQGQCFSPFPPIWFNVSFGEWGANRSWHLHVHTLLGWVVGSGL